METKDIDYVDLEFEVVTITLHDEDPSGMPSNTTYQSVYYRETDLDSLTKEEIINLILNQIND